ncbi:MAG: peptidase M28 [Bacteroides sp. SM23_62_1]|nr:MAG: peptidase M28 [Bacteroides sp. SM23_62_1]
MKKSVAIISFLSLLVNLYAQSQDSVIIRRIFDEALTSRAAYENLRYLCKNTKGRICGSPQAAEAVEFTSQVMLDMELDSVYLQELMVKRWVRGMNEEAYVISSLFGFHELTISGLGTSVGTGEKGIIGKVLEVQTFDDLEKLGTENIKGKLVFFNRPMDPTLINTFAAYGGAADQRTRGASEAARYGAIGMVIRSLTTALDDFPHTGVMYYEEGIPKIPAVSVSTIDAEQLSRLLSGDPDLHLHIISNCKNLDEVTSHNVVGELKGTVYPDQIITIGGHLDAWDTGEGAHDDGTGCIHAIEAVRLLKDLGIQPKRTIRAVMFMDEEIAQRGAKKYAELARENNEKHYAAIESDRGGLTPVGFGFTAAEERMEGFLQLKEYFKPYGITEFVRGGGGADIGPLREFGATLISFIPEMQRYFDYHHSPNDTFEQVNIRELQLGCAAIAALVYLIDKYDL